MPPRRTAPSNLVSFRFPDPLFGRLARTAELHGLSVGAYARLLVTTVLQDEDRLRVLDESKAIHTEVAALRNDVATALEAVLQYVNPKLTQEQVRQWISENLRR